MVLSKIEDSVLIKMYVEGNELAFETLLFRYKDKIFRYIQQKIKDSNLSNDIFQDTFVKVINTLKAGNYNEEGKFFPWAQRIAHNLIIDHFRKQNKVRMISESSSFDEEYSIFYKIASEEKNYVEAKSYEELESQMINLIQYLPKVQREIIEMRIFQDMSFKEIAEAENVSINTALGRMRYALINIRKMIEKHNMVTEI
ncbi:MAG: RNA polymerase sigma factor [Bacteroidota bacterium]|nr:sigma-70 family RNA polymerase sigma factor [Bacteroidota bacterium]